MRYAAIQDHCTLYAAFHGIDAGFHLRDHAAGNPAIGEALLHFGHRHFWDEITIGAKHAAHIGQHQKPLSRKRAGNCTRHRIGIDVIGLAISAHANGGHNGHDIRANHQFQHARVDVLGLTHKAKIEHFFDIAVRVAVSAHELARPHQPAILAGNPNREDTSARDGFRHLFVHRPRQHHFHHIQHGGIGHTQALHEGGFHIQALQHGVDLRPAAMHHHRVHAHLFQQRDIAAKAQSGFFFPHGVAAIFHYHDLVIIALQEGQSPCQDFHLFLGGIGHVGWSCEF